MFEDIQNHRQAVINSIAKSFGVDIEKAHQVGETRVGSDGKQYVWTEYAPGKYDWRAVKKTSNSGSQAQPKKEEGKEKKNSDKERAKRDASDLMDNELLSDWSQWVEGSDDVLDFMERRGVEDYNHPTIVSKLQIFVNRNFGQNETIKKLCDKYDKDTVIDVLVEGNSGVDENGKDQSFPISKETFKKVVSRLLDDEFYGTGKRPKGGKRLVRFLLKEKLRKTNADSINWRRGGYEVVKELAKTYGEKKALDMVQDEALSLVRNFHQYDIFDEYIKSRLKGLDDKDADREARRRFKEYHGKDWKDSED